MVRVLSKFQWLKFVYTGCSCLCFRVLTCKLLCSLHYMNKNYGMGQFYFILTRWIAKLLLQSTYCTYLSLVFHYVNMEGAFSCSCVDCWHEDCHEPLSKIGCPSLPFRVCSFNWSTFEVKWPQATSWAWYGFDDGVGMCSYDVTHLVINERHILVAMDYCTK